MRVEENLSDNNNIIGRRTHCCGMIDRLVGYRIMMLRDERGLDPDELAIALNVSADDVAAWEEGRQRLSASQMFELAKHLRVNIPEFFQLVRERY